MKHYLMTINDALWLATAILCVFYEHPIITGIVCVTTCVYAIDLYMKLAAMHYKLVPFIKEYWLDILFLIPICKLFRGFRILKVGRLLRITDALCDFTEIAFRIKNAVSNRRTRVTSTTPTVSSQGGTPGSPRYYRQGTSREAPGETKRRHTYGTEQA